MQTFAIDLEDLDLTKEEREVFHANALLNGRTDGDHFEKLVLEKFGITRTQNPKRRSLVPSLTPA